MPATTEHGGASTAAAHDAQLSAKALICKIVDKLKPDERGGVSYTKHARASQLLCALREAVSAGDVPTRKLQRKLAFTGIDVWRCSNVGGAEMDAESCELLNRTAVLIFATLSAIEVARAADEAVPEAFMSSVCVDAETEKQAKRVETDVFSLTNSIPLWCLLTASGDGGKGRKRARVAAPTSSSGGGSSEYETENDAADDEAEEDYDSDVEYSEEQTRNAKRATEIDPESLSACFLERGTREIRSESLGRLSVAATQYYRAASSACIQKILLGDASAGGFGGLGSMRLKKLSKAERDEKLYAIVQAADSEAGQQLIRDLALSFWLPANVVGVRRALLLPRAAQTAAGVDFPELMSRAHNLAMAGSEYVWKNSNAPSEKMVVLLAGLALMTTTSNSTQKSDIVRKAIAFNGRVQLPFLELVPPSGTDAALPRLCLLPQANRWVNYALRQNGTCEIVWSERGMRGFFAGALNMVF